MRLGDDEAEIIEDVAETLPIRWDGDTETDGEGALTAACSRG
jgi:hypothetical protein